MPLKEIFRKYHPLQIYIVLILTVFYFCIQLIVSRFSHSLTLLMDSYHVFCNVFALIGCIYSFKIQEDSQDRLRSESASYKSSLGSCEVVRAPSCKSDSLQCISPSETRLRNTFGWARLNILFMLIGCVLLASFAFSVVMGAIQTFCHISHLDEMHESLQVLSVGAIGMLMNGFCYLMIGGYTYYQGRTLKVGDSGDITLSKGISDMMNTGIARGQFKPQRQGPWEMTRDVMGCLMVMICALGVYWSDPSIKKYVDPTIAIISAIFSMILSYPFMREAGFILLQTIPNHIDIDSLCARLVEAFPNIVNVHEIHVWQLTGDKTVSTAHIIFLNPQDYLRSTKKLKDFFHHHGITHVTIQPEFYKDSNSMELISSQYNNTKCLIRCMKEECNSRNCCSSSDSEDLTSVEVPHSYQPIRQDPVDDQPLHQFKRTKERRKLPQSHYSKKLQLRHSTPILHLLKASQCQKKIKIVSKAGSPSCSRSCVQLQLRDPSSRINYSWVKLKRSLSAENVN